MAFVKRFNKQVVRYTRYTLRGISLSIQKSGLPWGEFGQLLFFHFLWQAEAVYAVDASSEKMKP